MGKSGSSRSGRADPEVSSRPERRRTIDDADESTPARTRSNAESVVSSGSRRRSSRRNDDRDDQEPARSSRQSVGSQGQYTAPNDSTSYVTSSNNDVNGRSRGVDEDAYYKDSKRDSRRDSMRDGYDDRRKDGESRDGERSKRRDSKRDSMSSRKSDKRESSRALDDHDAALPQNQFPGSFPETNTLPYRPPGHASEYYGDQGESVQFQPGVRPQGPDYVENAEQAHLYAPTAEAQPPPEPSSIGQVGAAASFYSAADSGNETVPATSSSRPPRISSSSQSTPARPGKMSMDGSTAFPGAIMGAAAAGAGAGYFAANNVQSSPLPYSNGSPASNYYSTSQSNGYQNYSYGASQSGQAPPQVAASGHNFGGVAAAGLAGAAAAGYLAHQHHENHHEHQNNHGYVAGSTQQIYPGMQQQLRHKHRGPLTKFADWFRDPQGVSQFEQYCEAIGVCKYCFDPNSSPADAPRKHYYHKSRPSPQPGRYGPPGRVEKAYRHSPSSSSSEDEKRKHSSTTKKMVAGGIAAYGAAKVGEAVLKHQKGFDDTYSVKTGYPIPSGESTVTVNRVAYEDTDMYGPGSRRQSTATIRYDENGAHRRKDSTTSRRSRREEEVYTDRKRSSNRRGSNTSPSGMSRSTAMGIGAAAGAAGLAAMTSSARDRSRSRSRERSSGLKHKKSYYSKRVSPRHSYVDLNAKKTGNTGFGGFFSSPSANEKKGKKKGFFTWNNDSSSSSDADLAFGEGTVRRSSQKGRSRRDSPSRMGNTAAILGLAATGAALAAESDRRKGKSRRQTNEYNTGSGSRRDSYRRISLKDQENNTKHDDEGGWEDASDDDMSSASVDTALAYGGRLSNKNSIESLAEQGTSKWDWRWNKNRDKVKSKEGRQSQQPYYPETPTSQKFGSMSAGVAAAAAGAGIGMATAATDSRQAPTSYGTPSPLPPMQFVEPFSASDPHLYEARRIQRPDDGPSPRTRESRSPVPLKHPQAINAPIVGPLPTVLNKLESDARLINSPTEIDPAKVTTERPERRRTDSVSEKQTSRRRNSSPPLINPSNISRNSVTWDLTHEQLENERRVREKEEKRRRRRDDEDSQRKSVEIASDPRKDSLERRSNRVSQIDQELEALRAEHQRQMEEQKSLDEYRRSHSEVGGVAAAIIAAGAGAAASAMVNDSKKSSESDSDKRPRRKSSLKNRSIDITPVETTIETSVPKENVSERRAEVVRERSRSPASPVHDSYASYFVPPEIAAHVKEHNDASKRDHEVMGVIDPSTLKRKPRFDPDLYSPYRPGRPHQPDYHPRGVPRLDLIEATPPGSPDPRSRRSKGTASSPLSQSVVVTEKDDDVDDAPLERNSESAVGSKVNWGDNKTHVFEVETPEYERNDPTNELDKVRTVDSVEAEQIAKENPDAASNSRQPVIEEYSPDPSPAVEVDLNDLLGGQPYQKPFYESVSDVGEIPVGDDQHRDIPKTGHGFAESLPESPVDEKKQFTTDEATKKSSRDIYTAVDDVPVDERPSRTGRRRLERAMSSSENVTPIVQTPQPESTVVTSEAGPDARRDSNNEASKSMPGGFGVFEYLVDEEGKQMTPEANREIEASATSVLSRRSQESTSSPTQKKYKDDDQKEFSKPKRASTFSDTKTNDNKTRSGTDYASDPEDWERSVGKKSKDGKSSKSKSEVGIGTREALAAVAAGAAAMAAAKTFEQTSSSRPKEASSTVGSEPDYYASSTKEKKKRRSKRESEIFDDFDNKSTTSLPATKDEDRESRRRSKRDSEIVDDGDDDSKSVVSMPATYDEEKKSKRRSKDKEREKDRDKEKRSSGIFSGIFSSNKSDVSTSSKKSSKSSKSESRIEREEDADREKRRKRRSRSGDDYDDSKSVVSEPASHYERHRSGASADEDSKPFAYESNNISTEEGFVSADDGEPNGMKDVSNNAEDQSFLARSLEMPPPTVMDIPMDTDGVSGPITTERSTSILESGIEGPENVTHADQQLPPLPVQTEAEESALTNAEGISVTPSVERTRRLSALRITDLDMPMVTTSSPTAVPLPFGRRGPFTPSSGQRSAQSPSMTSPLTTPRTRMNRPKSSSGKDFKPLYLVERHNSQKIGTPEPEEDLPSLPASRASSANVSMENLHDTVFMDDDEADILPHRGRDYSTSSPIELSDRRPSPDYLDSRAATPVPGDRQKARELEMDEIRLRKAKEAQLKALFHSPSELLQDPALNHEIEDSNVDIARVGSPLPSVVSTDLDQEFMSAESRPESPILVPEARQPRPRSPSRERPLRSRAPTPERYRERSMSIERRPRDRSSGNKASRSRSKTRSTSDAVAIAGLGIAGGVMAGLATGRTLEGHDEGLPRSQIVPDPDAIEEPSMSNKRAKRDKKKKRKTFDPFEDATGGDTIAVAATQDLPQAIPTVQEPPTDVDPQAISTPIEPADIASNQEEVDNFAPISTKKSKKGKKGKDNPTDMVLPLLNTATAAGAIPLQEEEPATALPVFTDSDEYRTSRRGVEQAFATAVTAGILAEREPLADPTDYSESISRDISPGQSRPTLPNHHQAASSFSEERFVPTIADLGLPDNKLGAFEEAFERAVHVRGLREGVTRDDAMEVFLPKRENAPFVPKMDLTPVPEGSPASVGTPAEELNDRSLTGESTDGVKRKLSKKDKKKQQQRKSTLSISGDLDEPSEDIEIQPRQQPSLPEDQPRIEEPETNLELPTGGSTQTLSPEPVAAIVPIEDQQPFEKQLPDEPQTLAEDEFSWAPSKKDKKKNKKKGQSSAPIPETVSQPDVDLDAHQVSREIDAGDIPSQTPVPAEEDEWSRPTGKKGKQPKKSKKSQASFDWSDAVAPATAVAGGIAVGAAAAQIFGDDDDGVKRTIVTETDDTQDHILSPLKTPERSLDNQIPQEDAPSASVLDDFTPVTEERGKKNKKKKSKSSKFDPWSEEAAPEPTASTAIADYSESTKSRDTGVTYLPTAAEDATQDSAIIAADTMRNEPQIAEPAVEAENTSLSRKASKKDKKKKSKGVALDWTEEPDPKVASSSNDQDTGTSRDILAKDKASMTPRGVTDVADVELATATLPGADSISPAVGDVIGVKQPQEQIPEAKAMSPAVPAKDQPSAIEASSEKPRPNPFAIDFSMSDAIAMSMGQTTAALAAAKAAKKSKPQVGQGPRWKTWTPSPSTEDLPLQTEAAENKTLDEGIVPAGAQMLQDKGVQEPRQLTKDQVEPAGTAIKEQARDMHSGEAQDISREIGESEAITQDDSWMPSSKSKKSKKDKKKRESRSRDEEVESEPVSQRESLGDRIQTQDEMPREDIVDLSTTDMPVEDRELQQTVHETKEDPSARSIAVDAQPNDFEEFTSTKKSKKDKKKRKSMVGGWDDSEPTTPAGELADPIEAQEAKTLEPTFLTQEPISAAPSTQEPQAETRSPKDDAVEAEDVWSVPATGKKSKKDKKKRQSTVDAFEPSEPTISVEPIDDPSAAVEADIMKPKTQLGEPVPARKEFSEVQPEIETTKDNDTEDFWSTPATGKKAKKDKKKRKSIAEFSEPVTPAEDDPNVSEPNELANSESLTLGREPSTSFEDPIVAIQADPEPQIEEQPREIAPEDTWSAPATGKKGKKDKKKRKSAMDLSEPATPADDSVDFSESSAPTAFNSLALTAEPFSLTGNPVESSQADHEPQAEEQSRDIDAEDSWSAPASGTKSRKDKKKRKSVIDFNEPATPAEEIADADDTRELGSSETFALAEDPVVTSQPDIETQSNEQSRGAEPEDFWSAPASGKKSKKDKKTRQSGSGIDESATPTEEVMRASEAATLAVSDAATLVESQEPLDQAETEPQVAVEASRDVEPTDVWSVPASGKKSKKDKKRKSAVELVEPTTPVEDFIADKHQARDIETLPESILTAEDQTAEDHTTQTSEQATEQPVEDEWSIPVKPSKKDKKKKKKSELALVDDEPSGVIEEISSSREPPQDFGNTATDDLNQAEDMSVVREVATAEQSIDDEWSVPMKLSKKDKKKKRKDESTAVSDKSATMPEPAIIPEESMREPQADVKDFLTQEHADPTGLEAATINQSAEDEWFVPIKSSKKDKKEKKKKGEDAVIVGDPVTETDLAAVPDEPLRESQIGTDTASVAPKAEPTLTAKDAELTLPVSLEKQVTKPIADDDSWAFTSKSKKKGKKHKDRSGTTTPGEADAIPPTREITDLVQDTASQQVEPSQPSKQEVTMEEAIEQEIASQQPVGTERIVPDPEFLKDETISSTPSQEQQTADNEWSIERKPSKKDKKKKKKSQSFDREDSESNAPAQAADEPVSTRSIDNGTTPQLAEQISLIKDQPVDDLHNHSAHQTWLSGTEDVATNFPMRPSLKNEAQLLAKEENLPGTSVKEAESYPAMQLEQAPSEPEADPEYTFASAKNSKKDKKKSKRQSAMLGGADGSSDAVPAAAAAGVAAVAFGLAASSQAHDEAAKTIDATTEPIHAPVETDRDHDATESYWDAEPEANSKDRTDAQLSGGRTIDDADDLWDDSEAAEARKDAFSDTVVDDLFDSSAKSNDEDTSWMKGNKKPKKAKKGKKGSVSMSSMESVGKESSLTQDSATLPMPRDSARDVEAVLSEEPISTPVDADSESAFASAVATPSETPFKETEEFSWTSALKKGRKDKKKRKSVTWSDADTSTPATPANEIVPEFPEVTVSGESEQIVEPPIVDEPQSISRSINTDFEVHERDVTTDNILEHAQSQDTKSDLPSPGTEKEDFSWPVNEKTKSKKDRKNKTTADDTQFEEPKSDLVTESSVRRESETEQNVPRETPADVDWEAPSSKKKKDKKKKRASSALALDEPEVDSTTSETFPLGESERTEYQKHFDTSSAEQGCDEVYEDVSYRDSGALHQIYGDGTAQRTLPLTTLSSDQTTDPNIGNDQPRDISLTDETVLDIPQVVETGLSTPVEADDEEWATGNKSRKDKKKRNRKSINAADPTSSDTSVLAATTAAIGVAGAAFVATSGPEIDDRSDSSAPRTEFVAEDERSIDTKKSKKDKKKKQRQSESYDDAPTTTEAEPRAETTREIFDEPIQQEAVQFPRQPPLPKDDEWSFETNASKKDKKKKRQSQVEDKDVTAELVEEPFTISEQITDRNLPPIDEPSLETKPQSKQTHVLPEDEWTFDTKKSKKDKKKSKKLTITDEDLSEVKEVVSPPARIEDTPIDDVTASATREVVETIPNEFYVPESYDALPDEGHTDAQPAAEETWESFGKKAKKDKKKKNRQSTFEENNESTVQDLREVNRDAVMFDVPAEAVSVTRDTSTFDEPLPVPRSIQDEQRIISQGEPDQAEFAEGFEKTASKKSKRSKKDKRKSLALTDDNSDRGDLSSGVVGVDAANIREISIPNYVRDYSAHNLHQTAEHQEYLSSAHDAASQFPPKPLLDNSAARRSTSHTDEPHTHYEPAHDSDVGSDVSDATRERRRRKRSPPLTREHDPLDLPRDRALTPSPEHDDLMDTALTIAAGLGFGDTHGERTRSDASSSGPRQSNHPSWSFENLPGENKESQRRSLRDSGIQFESPVAAHHGSTDVRDSGFVPSPPLGSGWTRGLATEEETENSRRRTRPQSPTSSNEDFRVHRESPHSETELPRTQRSLETPARRQPSAVDPASKERSSVLFNSSPAGTTPSKTPRSDRKPGDSARELQHSPDADGRYHRQMPMHLEAHESPSAQHTSSDIASNLIDRSVAFTFNGPASSPPLTHASHRRRSPSRGGLDTIHEKSSPLGVTAAGAAVLGVGAGAMASDSRDPGDAPRPKSLGKSKTRTSSQRNLRDATASPTHIPHESIVYPPPLDNTVANAGQTRGMSGQDVYDGYGSYPGSPASPTRPPSVRKRQSMQQIKDLETRVDQLANENRSLAEAKLVAERHLAEFQSLGAPKSAVDDEALRSATLQLQERDHEITKLRTEITALAATHATLKTSHDEAHTQWQESSRELQGLRSQHEELSSGMEDIVKHEITTALAQKNGELQRLRLELEDARLKIRELQSQILARNADEIVTIRDEDYFETACQNLCQHVQGWVVRFSKFSDTRVCRNTKEVRDEKVLDRFDSALLDGSDIDPYLADRVKRRDVFMSVVMTMIWEFVFTRYLFGMDRDQRQKLKQLEKNLSEVGPANAVHQWRALTLTLLSKREQFRAQCDVDTEAVVVEIMKTLSKFLPPPQNLEAQIFESLTKVMKVAVNLSIEMRTQKAEYIMLPPLQPEYDTNGDLTQKVYFNANLMNERSGEFESNDQLEESRAVVRIVLFPLVVKKGDDNGQGEEEIVVCPAQVLVARSDKGKRPKSRIASGGSVADARSLRAVSTHSLAMSGVDMTGSGNVI